MSSIEARFYEALVAKGLSPVPQFCIKGYFVDFAFPPQSLAVEADGAIHLQPATHQRDHRRDWILRRTGWTVMRFHGTTILHRPENCTFVVEREVRTRQFQIEQLAALELQRRQARREAWRHPFRSLGRFLLGRRPPRPEVVSGGSRPPN